VPACDFSPLLQQREDQFFYEVTARAFERSADASRFLDTLFFTLITTQTVIYAVFLGKIRECSDLLLGGFIAAVLGSALTLFVHKGPQPHTFAEDFPDDPRGTRSAYIESYVSKAKINKGVRAAKLAALGVSVVLTIIALLIATAWRARSA